MHVMQNAGVRIRALKRQSVDIDCAVAQLRENDGSKTTLIYLKSKLEHLIPVRKALDEEWWPEIQKHCSVDLRLKDPSATKEWLRASEMRLK